jgi:hypothetical protein
MPARRLQITLIVILCVFLMPDLRFRNESVMGAVKG